MQNSSKINSSDIYESKYQSKVVWLLGIPYEISGNSTGSASTSLPDRSLGFKSLINFSNSKESAIKYSLSEDFSSDFRSRLWMTYRMDFPQLGASYLTSDIGWGCMIRSAQMLLGSCVINHCLGRDWRFGKVGFDDKYMEIMNWFLDDHGIHASNGDKSMLIPRYYGIQKISKKGLKYDVQVGNWYGPRTISNVFRDLINEHRPIGLDGKPLSCYVAQDGTIYLDELRDLLKLESHEQLDANWRHSVLILLPIRLGIEKINDTYRNSLKNTLKLPQSCGIVGGKPNSAFYFVGLDMDQMIYLDPHVPRDAVNTESSGNISLDDVLSYHCDHIRRASISSLDPSLLLGFYIRNSKQWNDFIQNLNQYSILSSSNAIFYISDKVPSISSDDELDSFD